MQLFTRPFRKILGAKSVVVRGTGWWCACTRVSLKRIVFRINMCLLLPQSLYLLHLRALLESVVKCNGVEGNCQNDFHGKKGKENKKYESGVTGVVGNAYGGGMGGFDSFYTHLTIGMV